MTSSRTPAQAWGFGLIELLVALLIGSLMLLATTTLYLNMNSASADLARTSVQMEHGRMAIQLLRDDLQHVGFWNGFVPQFDDLTFADVPGDYPSAIPAPCENLADWTASHQTNLIGIPVALYNAVPTGCSTVLPDKAADTDVLVVRHLQTCLAGGACETSSTTSGRLYWQTSFCSTESEYVLGTSGFTLHKRDCSTLADRRRFLNHIYYIRDYALSPGDGIPTLMRSALDLNSAGTAVVQNAAEPMIEGIEAMRFEFGVDNVSDAGSAVNYTQAVAWASEQVLDSPTNRGDGAADLYCTSATPCDRGHLANTVLVKVYLLVRNLEPTPGYRSDKTYTLGGRTYGPFSDGFQRHVYSTTVRLTNISGRRETP